MLGTARVLARNFIPYATWVATAVQLGYVGYNMLQMYQRYIAQCERDQRDGIDRTVDETIELVIKPRRRRPNTINNNNNNSNETPAETTGESTEQEQQQPQLSDGHQHGGDAGSGSDNDGVYPSTSAFNQDATDTPSNNPQPVGDKDKEKENAGGELNGGRLNGGNSNNFHGTTLDGSDEVTIIHDSRLEKAHVDDGGGDDVLDDISTHFSTSLESTDSNNGIIKDMYTECFICARSLDDSRKPVATLPFCMHPFHKTCLEGVLKWHQRCPVCDFHIFSPI